MPNLSTDLEGTVTWLSGNALQLLVVAVLLLVGYRVLRPWIHRVLVRMMYRQPLASGDTATKAEMDRRVATIEDLLAKVLRALVVAGLVCVVLGIFDLWSLVAALGLVLAALTLAGQSIVLDYLMGMLILVEGQYFKGDTVQLGGIEGVVEEVGLRRTLVRDVRGILHSISNGTIRQSANLTRTYAAATVEIDGVADRDVETVIEVLNEAGKAMAEDPEFSGIFQDVPGYASTTRLSSSGATLRMSGRVQPEARARIEAEMRRRVAAGLAAKGVELIRPTSYPPR
jgi:moderate conductance mechanosensitive channel